MAVYDYGRSPEHWLKAIDIASSKLTQLDPKDSSLDVFCWMSANDFDVVFLKTDPVTLVERSSLEHCREPEPIIQYSSPLHETRVFPAGLSMNQAFQELANHHWIVLSEGKRILGIVTHDDLAKPAASAFILGHLIAIERVLRRMYGTYVNQPVPDEPPSIEQGDQKGDEDVVAYLADLINRIKKSPSLLKELGYSRTGFERVGGWLVTLRNQLAHSRGLRIDDRKKKNWLERFFEIQKLKSSALRVLEDRDQIWQAIADSVITDSQTGVFYAGPSAVGLPLTTPAYVVTAANPFEEYQSEETNEHRNKMLLSVLQRNVKNVVSVVGGSRCGNWRENSFMINGVSEEWALELAQQYGQRAIFKLTDSQKVVLATTGEVKSQSSRHE